MTEEENIQWLTIGDLLDRLIKMISSGELSKQSYVFIEANNPIGIKPAKRLCTICYNPREDIARCYEKAEEYKMNNKFFLEKEQLAKIEILKTMDYGNALMIKNIIH